MTLVAIHQPQFMPWLGYFDKIDRCDIFCFLDTVQFKKNEFQNRNRIRAKKGWQWLTAPVVHRFPQRIEETEINNRENWRRKHLETLKTHYRKAPFFSMCMDRLEAFYSQQWIWLAHLNMASARLIMEMMGMEKKTVPASELNVATDHPTERLVRICKRLGGDAYLSGKDGASYMDLEVFRDNGVRVFFQDFHHPVYPQVYDPFEPYMSALDLVLNCGTGSLDFLREARRPLLATEG